MRTNTAQFAFFWVVLILHLGVSNGTAQTPVTRPAISVRLRRWPGICIAEAPILSERSAPGHRTRDAGPLASSMKLD